MVNADDAQLWRKEKQQEKSIKIQNRHCNPHRHYLGGLALNILKNQSLLLASRMYQAKDSLTEAKKTLQRNPLSVRKQFH